MATTESAIAFLHQLELPEYELDAEIAAAGGGAEADKEAYVDAGSLVSFVRGVPLQHKEDVLNSTLLAQLAANAKFNREKQALDWYEFYRTVLENVGWVIPDYKWNNKSDLGAEFTADAVILKLIEAIGTGNDVAIVAEAFAALQSLAGNDPTAKLFEVQSHSDRAGAFQIGAAAESDGVVVMKLAVTYFETTQTVVRVLWFRFQSSSTQFYRGTVVMELNDRIYVKVREMVIEKLGKRAVEFVKGLKT